MARSFVDSDDFEVKGEALQDVHFPIQVDPDRWYAARPQPDDVDGQADGVNVWGVLRSTRFAPHAKQEEAVEAIPPEYADIALALLRSGDSIAERALAARTLKKELGSDEVFARLRADARALRKALAASAAEGAQDEAMDGEVRSFLGRCWVRIAEARPSRRRARPLRRVAELFGGLLAQVPEVAIRRAFERNLLAWTGRWQATGAALRGEEPAGGGGVSDGARAAAKRIMRRLGQQLSASEDGISEDPPTPLAIAKALAAAAAADTEAVEEQLDVYCRCVERLGPAELGATDLWSNMADAAPSLRLWLLHAAISHGGGGARVLKDSGIGRAAALLACTDFAFEEREEAPAPVDDGEQQLKQPRTRRAFKRKRRQKGEWWGPRTATVDGKPVPRRVPQRPAEELAAAASRAREETVARAGRVLEHLAAVGGLAELGETDALGLFRCLGKHMGVATPHVLRPLLAGSPGAQAKFSEAELLPVACGLPTTVGTQLWTSMAVAFVERWFHLESDELLRVMSSLPTDLAAAPAELLEALAEACDRRPGAALALGSDQLAALTQAWVARPVPLPLKRLFLTVVHKRLLTLDARHLVLASRIIDEGAPVSGHLQQTGALVMEPLAWWRRWMEHAMSSCRHAGWGRCREALREVQEWRSSAKSRGARTALAQQVLEEVVVHRLVNSSTDVPLEVLLSVHNAAEGAEVLKEVTGKLEFKVRQCLQEDGSRLPLATAVAVGNGETPVSCSPGGVLWAAVVATIARSLQTQREVDFFCRCHPSPALYDAVAQQADEGWCSLELQLRRPALWQPPEPADT